MITAAKLAGFFAAHAIWSVSDSEMLTPMFAFTTAAGERRMDRLAGNDLEKIVVLGKARLAANEDDADDAAFLFDGRIPIGERKYDAIIVEMRAYFSPRSAATLGIPYTPKSAGGFRVHKPKILQWQNCEDFSLQNVVSAFFEGVDAHEQGAKVWNAALDQSI